MEYRSEATEVAVLLKENPDSIGLLPQPNVSTASGCSFRKSFLTTVTPVTIPRPLFRFSHYLETLFEQDPEFIGGAMPGDDFYEVR